MSFESFDATPLIENAGFLALLELPESAEAGSEPTLDSALQQTATASTTALPMDREEMREATLLDLWGGAATRTAFTPLTIGAMAALAEEGPAGNDDAAESSGPTGPSPEPADGDASTPDDRPLTVKEMKLVANGNRQFDSTDYYWNEMSTGDYEWAMGNFQHDVYHAVEEASRDATTPEEAAQLAQDYLNSIGLGSLVHVNNPAAGSGSEVFVTGNTLYHPTTYMPVLSMDHDGLGFVDLSTMYETLDEDAITVDIQVPGPLTTEQEAAIQKLYEQIAATTTMLNSLPANGVFTFPDGKTITVGELRELWARADFVVTSQTYTTGSLTLPGVGAARRNDGDPLFEVSINGLVHLMSNPSFAMAYPLHELAHVTVTGEAKNAAIWADGVRTDLEHHTNEAFAHSMSMAIAEAAGQFYSPGFLGLMEDSLALVPRPIFSVPDSGGTGGGGTGGGGGEVSGN